MSDCMPWTVGLILSIIIIVVGFSLLDTNRTNYDDAFMEIKNADCNTLVDIHLDEADQYTWASQQKAKDYLEVKCLANYSEGSIP